MKNSAMMESKQPKLVEVSRSPVAEEAERYAEMQNDLESKKAEMVSQSEKVLAAMQKIGQKVFGYTDEWGYKHTFTVVEGVIKLRHAKREEN